MTKLRAHADNYQMGEYQKIALGLPAETWSGWWFWLRYWSPPVLWWLRLQDWWHGRKHATR